MAMLWQVLMGMPCAHAVGTKSIKVQLEKNCHDIVSLCTFITLVLESI